MMCKPLFLGAAAGAALLLVASNANAQLNNQWVTFTKQPSKLAVSATTLSDSQTQCFMKTADLDQDTNDVQELYRVDLKSGVVTRLNAPLVQDGDVVGFLAGT